ncbi:MAG: SPOR domain-containing protein [Proteobacteria bacterium]|nr:SPOR domain-containing protein [Pseudomonadota bacterium]
MKTRLLGAAVLIALAIIFVPMFFSRGSQKSADDQNVSLKIPDQPDAQLQTRTLSVAASSASVVDPDRVATVNADAGKPAPAPQDLTVASSQPAAAGSATPAKTAPGATPAPSAIAKATPVTPSPAPGTAASGAYSLNLGTYGERGNADKLIASVGKQGYSAHGESTTYQGKPATRVVAGPFADRAAAEAARLKLKGTQPGVPVALMASAGDQTGDAPASAVPAGKAGAWAVQLGAFGAEADANKLRDRLRVLGFDGYVDSIPSGGGKLFRVRAGPVTERAAAEQLKAQIAAKLKISGIIVTQS